MVKNTIKKQEGNHISRNKFIERVIITKHSMIKNPNWKFYVIIKILKKSVRCSSTSSFCIKYLRSLSMLYMSGQMKNIIKLLKVSARK